MCAGEHGGVVAGLVLEPDRCRLDDRTEPGDQAHGNGRGDQHRRRDDHGQRGALPARGGLAGLFGRHLGHPGILARRVTQTVEHAARDAQDRRAR
jgi:hypothetical protein